MVHHHAKFVILGGGLAGLAAAMEFQRLGVDDFVIIEGADECGGIARTSHDAGWEIDLLPHVFFTAREDIKQLYRELVPDSHETLADLGVFLDGNYLPYPFQLNIHALPHDKRVECLASYFTALEQSCRTATNTNNFESFLNSRFGTAIVDTFFRPYNEKLWQTSLGTLSTDWVHHKIDSVDHIDMAHSFLGPRELGERPFGAHARFLYPDVGGIQRLPDAMAARVGPEHIQLNTRVLSVNGKRKEVHTDKGVFGYQRAVWTLPANRAGSVLGVAFGSAQALSHNIVTSVHLVVSEVIAPKTHWLYVTDSSLSPYRITRMDLLSHRDYGGNIPLIVEVSHPSQSPPPEPRAVIAKVVEDLVTMRFLSSPEVVKERASHRFSPAYVIHDRARPRRIRQVHDAMRRRGVIPAGRFGEWHFFNMDHSIDSGQRAAREAVDSTSRGQR